MMDFKDGKREKTIIKTALIGIVTNFFLAAAKILSPWSQTRSR
nr:hypothetical protein [uncultured Campylobacter sp.]